MISQEQNENSNTVIQNSFSDHLEQDYLIKISKQPKKIWIGVQNKKWLFTQLDYVNKLVKSWKWQTNWNFKKFSKIKRIRTWITKKKRLKSSKLHRPKLKTQSRFE